MKRLALITYAGLPDLVPDDRPLLEALEQYDIHAEPLEWERSADRLDTFDGLVLRSCWNYHLELPAFRRWLDALDHIAPPVWNPPPVLRWNLDKRHLVDLAARGVPIPETRVVDAASAAELETALRATGWPDLVVKPAISLSAYKTVRVREGCYDALPGLFDDGHPPSHLLVQRFVPEVLGEGELSFTFIDGRFSHAIRKCPRQGDFRVQEDFGGRREPASPADALVGEAGALLEAALELLPPGVAPLLYARVDVVQSGGRLVLMELELIDPMLFFDFTEGSARRFARAVRDRL